MTIDTADISHTHTHKTEYYEQLSGYMLYNLDKWTNFSKTANTKIHPK